MVKLSMVATLTGYTSLIKLNVHLKA